MLYSVPLKTLWRNKGRTLILMIGITISISLITSVFISSDRYSNDLIQEALGTIEYDIAIWHGNDNLQEEKEALSALEEFDTFQSHISMEFDDLGDLSLKKSNGIEFNFSSHEILNETYLNHTNFLGIDFLYDAFEESITNFKFLNKSIEVLSLNKTLLENGAIIIDQKFAQDLSIGIGDKFDFAGNMNDYDDEIEDWVSYNASIYNITVGGIIRIKNFGAINNLLEKQYKYSYNDDYYHSVEEFQTSSRIVIANYSTIENLCEEFREQFRSQAPSTTHIPARFVRVHVIQLDYDFINFGNTQLFTEQIETIQNQMELVESVNGMDWGYSNQLSNIVNYITGNNLMLSIFMFLVTIPIIILSLFLTRTNYNQMFQQRRREVGLLKTKAASTKQITRLYIFEASIIGILSSILGILLGNGFSAIVYSNVIKEEQTTFGSFIQALFNFDYLSLSDFLIFAFLGIALTLISALSPIRKYSKLKPVDALEEFNEIEQSAPLKKKKDIVFLLIGLVPTLIATLYYRGGDIEIFNNFFFMIILQISTPILPFAGFILIYAVVKISCDRSLEFFGKIITKTSKIFSKEVSHFTVKSILRNQKRSARLIFLISLSLGFLLTSITLIASESDFQDTIKKIEFADGEVSEIYVYGANTPKNLTEITTQELFSTQNYSVSLTNWYFAADYDTDVVDQDGKRVKITISEHGWEYETRLDVGAVSALNYSKLDVKDNWIEGNPGESYHSLMNRLATTPNTCLLPIEAKSDYTIGENLTFQFADSYWGSEFSKNFTIIGYYNLLPLASAHWGKAAIIDYSTNFSFNNLYISLQGDNLPTGNDISEFLSSVGINNNYYDYSSADEFVEVFGVILRYLEFERVYMILILIIAVGLISFTSIREKAHDFAMLRARGVPKSLIYKIQFSEALILGGFGVLFSLIGIFATSGLLIEFDLMFSYGQYHRDLIVPTWSVLGFIVLTFSLFMGVIATAVASESRKSNVGSLAEVLRVRG